MNLLEALKKLLFKKDRIGECEGDRDKVKETNVSGPLWKKINMMAIAASAGILLMVLANLFTPGKTPDPAAVSGQNSAKPEVSNSATEPSPDISLLENDIAQKLEKALSQIEGAGEVQVTVNLASTTTRDYAVNTNTDNKKTLEHDQKGGNRTITETNEQGQMVLVRQNQESKEEPVMVKENKPEVKGVIVVAEGVKDPVVKADLMRATQVYLDIPLYRVVVLHKGSR